MFYVAFQQFQEVFPRHGVCSHSPEMRCVLLHVDDVEVVLDKELAQMIQRYLGGVGPGVEHRLAAEDAADGNTIKSSYQLVVVICLNGMRET